ncbi:TIGR02285 family protein [Pseudoduganella sp.]|uniref:TIGR02285 family protein n=1 Tax=Pseudoduganella sp. TaxID=1880898 RepID=UPI0035B23FBA
MTRRLLPSCLAAAAVLAAPPLRADEQMTWLMSDFPPITIPVDGAPTTGIADQIVRYLARHWGHDDHRYVYANSKRTWLMLERGSQACFAAALRTPERERTAYFSNTSLVPPPVLIVRADMLPSLPLNAAGEVVLAQLLARRAARGAIVENRSYGPQLDAMLAQHPEANLEKTAIGDYGRNVLLMVARGRADYTFDYDFALAYGQSLQAELAQLRTVAIAGNAQAVLAGVACPRTPWGRRMIRKIDSILGTPAGADMLMRAQDTWLTPAGKQRYQSQMAAFQRLRSKPGAEADYR